MFQYFPCVKVWFIHMSEDSCFCINTLHSSDPPPEERRGAQTWRSFVMEGVTRDVTGCHGFLKGWHMKISAMNFSAEDKRMMLLLGSSYFALWAFRSLCCELKIASVRALDNKASWDSEGGKSEQCCQQAVALVTAPPKHTWSIFSTRLESNPLNYTLIIYIHKYAVFICRYTHKRTSTDCFY